MSNWYIRRGSNVYPWKVYPGGTVGERLTDEEYLAVKAGHSYLTSKASGRVPAHAIGVVSDEGTVPQVFALYLVEGQVELESRPQVGEIVQVMPYPDRLMSGFTESIEYDL